MNASQEKRDVLREVYGGAILQCPMHLLLRIPSSSLIIFRINQEDKKQHINLWSFDSGTTILHFILPCCLPLKTLESVQRIGQ
jgi:hypothetical protein